MGKRTYALYKKEVYSWIDLLDKFKIYHQEGASAHVEWDKEVLINKKLPNIKVVDKDDNELVLNKHNDNNELSESRITKRHREFVWKRDIGNSKSGKCYTCNCTITDDNFETGHIILKCNGGNTNVKNLRTVCIPCNRAMGTMNLEDFKKDFMNFNYTNKNELSRNDVIEYLKVHKFNYKDRKSFENVIKQMEMLM